MLTQIESFTGELDDNKADIVDAIEALDRLAKATRAQQGDINSALDELPSALTSIDGQRADLVKMLQALSDLGDVGVRVIKASKAATIDSITQLQPVLTELANSGDSFVKAFHVFLTYPFVDEVVGRDPQVARNLHMGDYTNLSITLDIDLTEGLPDGRASPTSRASSSSRSRTLGPLPPLSRAVRGRRSTRSTSASPPERRELPGAAGLPRRPGLRPAADPGPVPGRRQRSAAAACPPRCPRSSCPTSGSTSAAWADCCAPAPASTAPSTRSAGPTMGQLSQAFDPGLVALLVPGMVVDRRRRGEADQ